MHAADHEEPPEGAEDGHDDQNTDAAKISKAEERVSDQRTDLVADGGEDDEGDGDRDDHGAKRREDRGEHVGMTFLKNFSTK